MEHASNPFDMQQEERDCPEHGRYRAMHFAARWTGCPKCAEISNQVQAEAARRSDEQARVDRLLELAHIPERYRMARLEHLPTQHHAQIEAWLKGAATQPGGLIMLGSIGVGKTYAAAGLVRAACERRQRASYTTVAGYLRRLRESWDRPEITEKSVFDSFISPRILVLDEVGLGLNSERDGQRVHEAIAERYDRMLPTVFVSNLTSGEFRDALGDRVHDRIRENATVIAMAGSSRRTTKGPA